MKTGKYSANMEILKEKLQGFLRENLANHLVRAAAIGALIFLILCYPMLNSFLAGQKYYSEPDCESFDYSSNVCEDYSFSEPVTYLSVIDSNFSTATRISGLIFVFLVASHLLWLVWSSAVHVVQEWKYTWAEKNKHDTHKEWSGKIADQMVKNLNYWSTHQDEYYERERQRLEKNPLNKDREGKTSHNLKKFIKYEGKTYFVDLSGETLVVDLVKSDGTTRPALTSEVNFMDLLNEGTTTDVPPDYNPRKT